MNIQLTVLNYVERKSFMITEYMEQDDVFALTLEGSFRVECEGKCYTVSEGEGFLFRRNVFYRREVLSPVKLFLFRYQSETHAFAEDHVLFRDRERIFSTLSMLKTLHDGIYKNNVEIGCHLFRDVVVQYELEQEKRFGSDPPIEEAIKTLKAKLGEGADLFSLASKSGLSYVQFFRRFKAYTGLTPSEYLNSVRLQKAKQLLSNSALLVREIAFACGFENEYYFSNFFKKHTATSPTAFRLLSK